MIAHTPETTAVKTNIITADFILLFINSLPQIVEVIIDGIRAIVVIAKNLNKLISVAETIYVKISFGVPGIR